MILESLNDERETFETLCEWFSLECTEEAINLIQESSYDGYTMEGTNIEVIKEFLGKERRLAKRNIHAGNFYYSRKEYGNARMWYERGKKHAEAVKERLVTLDNNAASTLISWLIPFAAGFANIIAGLDGTMATRKLTTSTNYADAYDETMSWNFYKASAVANVIKLIRWCDVRIKQCDARIRTKRFDKK